ncbi:SchA/CurD-like domain-containing protein [Streptomyces sp. NPDC059506]|uniref:SchA/CurD-like domain-containing protein n=1 Tax=Streptomyces TaxID=1883 RepID=UPI0015FBCCBD|nr:SchA/CurD-like domain-containing protein [Streptomyces sp. SCUT-3]QMV22680.1 TcmI family type II polyketide cyclase [Streptomyces sp. SCUT-3]
MTTLSERPHAAPVRPDVPDGPGGPKGSRLRVLLMLDLHEGAGDRFLDAYEDLRHLVAATPGHIKDQLCQSIDDPSQWLITSEWEDARPFLEWVDSQEHRDMVKPMRVCIREMRSLRFEVVRETSGPADTGAPAPDGTPRTQAHGTQANGAQANGTKANGAHGPASRPCADGVVRHGLTFTVRPGSEQAVAEIMSGYAVPETRVDDETRLLRTSLFMHRNRVVRVIEVGGDLAAALRHVAAQPEVQAVEDAVRPHLEENRDLGSPEAAREFYARAALPLFHHAAADGPVPGDARRRAFLYPVRPGCGGELARLLARRDDEAVADPAHPVVRSTVLRRDDTVVRVVDTRTAPEDGPAAVLGLGTPRQAAAALRLLEAGAETDTAGEEGLRSLLADCDMALVTDRLAQDR